MQGSRSLQTQERFVERVVQIECPPPPEEREIRYKCYKEIRRTDCKEKLN